jgi:hypothetical protein
MIDDELEQAFSDKKSAREALDSAVERRQPPAASVRTRQPGPVAANRSLAFPFRPVKRRLQLGVLGDPQDAYTSELVTAIPHQPLSA